MGFGAIVGSLARWLIWRARTDRDRRPARAGAYLDRARRAARFAGFVACLVGVLMLVLGALRLGGAPWLLWAGLAVIAARLGAASPMSSCSAWPGCAPIPSIAADG